MKTQFLPFQIGEQYENWEFELEVFSEERIDGLDAYHFLGKKPFLNVFPDNYELIFQIDLLVLVILKIETLVKQDLAEIRITLSKSLGEKITKYYFEHLITVYKISQDLSFLEIYNSNNNQTIYLYGQSNLINSTLIHQLL